MLRGGKDTEPLRQLNDPTKEMTKQDFLRMASHIRAGLLSMSGGLDVAIAPTMPFLSFFKVSKERMAKLKSRDLDAKVKEAKSLPAQVRDEQPRLYREANEPMPWNMQVVENSLDKEGDKQLLDQIQKAALAQATFEATRWKNGLCSFYGSRFWDSAMDMGRMDESTGEIMSFGDPFVYPAYLNEIWELGKWGVEHGSETYGHLYVGMHIKGGDKVEHLSASDSTVAKMTRGFIASRLRPVKKDDRIRGAAPDTTFRYHATHVLRDGNWSELEDDDKTLPVVRSPNAGLWLEAANKAREVAEDGEKKFDKGFFKLALVTEGNVDEEERKAHTQYAVATSTTAALDPAPRKDLKTILKDRTAFPFKAVLNADLLPKGDIRFLPKDYQTVGKRLELPYLPQDSCDTCGRLADFTTRGHPVYYRLQGLKKKELRYLSTLRSYNQTGKPNASVNSALLALEKVAGEFDVFTDEMETIRELQQNAIRNYEGHPRMDIVKEAGTEAGPVGSKAMKNRELAKLLLVDLPADGKLEYEGLGQDKTREQRGELEKLQRRYILNLKRQASRRLETVPSTDADIMRLAKRNDATNYMLGLPLNGTVPGCPNQSPVHTKWLQTDAKFTMVVPLPSGQLYRLNILDNPRFAASVWQNNLIMQGLFGGKAGAAKFRDAVIEIYDRLKGDEKRLQKVASFVYATIRCRVLAGEGPNCKLIYGDGDDAMYVATEFGDDKFKMRKGKFIDADLQRVYESMEKQASRTEATISDDDMQTLTKLLDMAKKKQLTPDDAGALRD